MPYYADLSTLELGQRSDGYISTLIYVGWLSEEHEYPKGPVPKPLIRKLKKLARHPVELTLGYHICDLCPQRETRVLPPDIKGNGEIHLPLRNLPDSARIGVSSSELANLATESEPPFHQEFTYCAPTLIVHYIEAHGYRPPEPFLAALEAMPL